MLITSDHLASKEQYFAILLTLVSVCTKDTRGLSSDLLDDVYVFNMQVYGDNITHMFTLKPLTSIVRKNNNLS